MIIIPTYNERGNIRMLVERIRAHLPEMGILFVDDNSPDGTSQEIKGLQETDSNIQLISRADKLGFASAYLDGFKFVLAQGNPRFIVTMDADLSHPPEKLFELISIAESGKIAIGSRYTTGGAVKNWKFKRKILSRLANFYARTLTQLSIADITAGFMAIPVAQLRQIDLSTIQNRGYAFLVELKTKLAGLGAEIVEVPIIFEERREGESKLASSTILEGIKYPVKLFVNRQIKENYLAWLIFFVTFGVYAATLSHTIFLGDSAEYIAATATLGIPHPSGNPGYILLAHLFTWLPLGTLAFRIGLLSVLFASLGLTIFYKLLCKLGDCRVAFVASLVLAFSDMFWSQAIMVKVYSALFFFTLLILYWLVRFLETDEDWYVPAIMFVFGLGIGFHESLVLFLPLLLLVFLIRLYRISKHADWLTHRYDIRPFLWGLLLFALGLATYLYFPIRAQMNPVYDFTKIFHLSSLKTVSGAYDYLARANYADFAQKFSWSDKKLFEASFFFSLWQQFGWLLIIAIAGLIWLAAKSKSILLLTAGIFLFNSTLLILLRSTAWNFENEFLYSYYYLPAFAMAAFWIGCGLAWLLGLIKNFKFQPVYIFILFLLLPALLFKNNLPANNLKNFTFSDDYTRKLLQSLPPNAVLLTSFDGAVVDTVTFGLHYQQIVGHIRPDVTILATTDIYPEVDRKIIAQIFGLDKPEDARYQLVKYAAKIALYNTRPIYTTFLADNLSKLDHWSSRSNGLVYEFLAGNPSSSPPGYIQLDYQKDQKALESNLFGRDLLAQYFYGQAAYFADQHNLAKAEENYIRAINLDDQVMGIDDKSFLYHRNLVFGKL